MVCAAEIIVGIELVIFFLLQYFAIIGLLNVNDVKQTLYSLIFL